VQEIISQWPVVTAGEDVGLSPNASTITARNDAMRIFGGLIEIEPTLIVASGSVSSDQFAVNLVERLIRDVPAQFNIFNFKKKFDLTDAIDTVLYHQIVLYNHLLEVIRQSLKTLKDGLVGMIVMDEKLDALNRRLLANKIPELWLQNSFPSVLSLRNYMDDLKARISFLDQWIRTERPKVFKLGSFYHPEEFLTAILQNYARRHSVAFDSLKWSTVVTDLVTIEAIPEDGIYAEGLWIEGAKWDKTRKQLQDCGQTELISTLPIVQLLPTSHKRDTEGSGLYECPLYRTQNRGTGALDLPNYIMSLDLNAGAVGADHWIQRSVAVFITV
jgi:hypothetical protein